LPRNDWCPTSRRSSAQPVYRRDPKVDRIVGIEPGYRFDWLSRGQVVRQHLGRLPGAGLAAVDDAGHARLAARQPYGHGFHRAPALVGQRSVGMLGRWEGLTVLYQI
jgi:hypothetical protein